MSPWVVLALKFGAMDPNRRRGCSPAGVANVRLKSGKAAGKARWSLNAVGLAAVKLRAAIRGAVRVSKDAIVMVPNSLNPRRP